MNARSVVRPLLRVVAHLAGAGALLLAARGSLAQTPAGAPGPAGWRVTRDPFADLWFHTMALVGDQGFGTLPLYDAAHAQRVRRSRVGQGIPVRFDDPARTLRARVAGDSALELLHFVPMYFVGVAPRVALAALREAAEPVAGAPVSRDRAHAAARAIAAALGSAHERSVLLAVVAAAADEWRAGAMTPSGALAGEPPVAVAELQRAWDERFAPLVGARLAASGAARGVVIVSPALAAEGRVAQVAPWGTVVAVGAQTGAADDAPLLSAVREMSYAVLDRVLPAPAPGAEGRVAASRRRDAAAVRAGEMLLAGDPALASRYRALFAAALGRPAASFDQLFPLDSTSERTLRGALSSSR